MWGRFTRRRPVLYLALAALGALAIVLALFLLPTHFGIPPPPLFHVSLNSSSAKGFLLTDRPDNSHPQYNLEKGERGSVEMIFVSETDQSLQLDVVATVGSDWEDPPLQPPGVTVSITRETEEKVRTYAQRGVLGVDMETSAMYALGIFRGVEVCNLLTVSDGATGILPLRPNTSRQPRLPRNVRRERSSPPSRRRGWRQRRAEQSVSPERISVTGRRDRG